MQPAMIPIPEKSLTQQIQSEKEKLQLMRKRDVSANTLMASYQEDLDKLREESDTAFFLYTSAPSKANDKLYEEAQAKVNKLIADFEEAQAVKRRLPNRLKNAERAIHSLQRQKQESVHKLANQKLGKKREIAMSKASDSIVSAVALTAVTSPSGDLNNFLNLGNIDTHALVTQIVSSNEFRIEVDKEYKSLLKSLRIESI